jgi:hypothetical protein
MKNNKLLKMIERANMADFELAVDEDVVRFTFVDDRFLLLNDL